MHSFGGAAKATQAIATEIADYSKRSFDRGTKTMENLHATKLGQLYADLAKEAVPGFCSR
jgi:hypothetical protein